MFQHEISDGTQARRIELKILPRKLSGGVQFAPIAPGDSLCEMN